MFSKLMTVLIICIMLLASGANAAYAPTQQTLSVGGITFVDLDNLIILIARIVTAGNATTFRKLNATTGYTPSGSKAFRVWAMRGLSSSTTTSNQYQIFYADNDGGIDGSGGSFTNIITPGGMSAALASPGWLPIGLAGTTSSGEAGFGKGGFLVLNGKFPAASIATSGSSFVTMYGYEE